MNTDVSYEYLTSYWKGWYDSDVHADQLVWQVVYEQAGMVRRPSGRGLEYRDSAYESRRHSQFSGMSMESFRLLSVLGRGHFGKVKICSWKSECELWQVEAAI